MFEHARSLLSQHARTTQLLGVDFLPIGTPPPFSSDEGNDPAPPPTEAPKTESVIEPKPLRDFAPTNSTPAFAVASTAGAVSGFAIPDFAPIRAAYESLEDPPARMEALRDKYISDAPHNQFNTTFTNIVFGEGNASADLMFVGEAPGQNEDETGRPFVGRAGELLDKMIVAMGLGRESVYITNVLKTRPPNNATPTREESLLCAPYLYEQIRIINPKVIVTLGLPASHLLLDSTRTMRDLRGQFHAFPAADQRLTQLSGMDPIDVMPTYHPAYLLRAYTDENRRKVWSDLTKVMDRLGLSRP